MSLPWQVAEKISAEKTSAHREHCRIRAGRRIVRNASALPDVTMTTLHLTQGQSTVDVACIALRREVIINILCLTSTFTRRANKFVYTSYIFTCTHIYDRRKI